MTSWRGSSDPLTTPDIWQQTASNQYLHYPGRPYMAGEFLSFVNTRCQLAECDARTVEVFVATLSGYQAKTVEQKLCAVRSFLRYAGYQGEVNADVLKAVP